MLPILDILDTDFSDDYKVLLYRKMAT